MITELGLDCGDICKKITIPIPDDMNCEQLYTSISEMSPELIEKTLKEIAEQKLVPEKQCESGVCFANKLQKEETLIDFTKPAKEIHNLVRGIYKSPSAYFMYNNKIIKVLKTKVCDGCGTPGDFTGVSKDGITIACGENCLLVEKVKPEGKGEMPARDWYNGIINRG